MFRKYCVDPFNWENNRNIRNTAKDAYNCAGYALETFSWYCPHDTDGDCFGCNNYSFSSPTEGFAKTMICVNKMIEDFNGKLRVLPALEDLDKETERAVAFRISSDGDFHYIKKAANGRWYHKRGSSYTIEEMTEWDVFNSRWCWRYNGPVALLAIKK